MICKCGCGWITSVAKRSDPEKGWIKGKHLSYVAFHHHRADISTELRSHSGYVYYPNGSEIKTRGSIFLAIQRLIFYIRHKDAILKGSGIYWRKNKAKVYLSQYLWRQKNIDRYRECSRRNASGGQSI